MCGGGKCLTLPVVACSVVGDMRRHIGTLEVLCARCRRPLHAAKCAYADGAAYKRLTGER